MIWKRFHTPPKFGFEQPGPKGPGFWSFDKMMRWIRQLFNFFGSIYCAVILIGVVALLAIAGTLLESYSDSHGYASSFTYGNPMFITLLWGFFVNILFAALRRWPFKLRHIPFLITHLGLLMILGGTMIKQQSGVQGVMAILEGAANETIFLPNTYALLIEKRNPADSSKNISHHFSISRHWWGAIGSTIVQQGSPFPELRLQLMSCQPHCHERLESWLKGDHAFITGLPPFQVYEINETQKIIPISARAHLSAIPWNLFALRTTDVKETIKRLYSQAYTLNQRPLSEALEQKKVQLLFDYSPIEGIKQLAFASEGKQAVLNGTPTLAFIQDAQGDTFLFALNEQGIAYTEAFRQDNLSSLLVFDRGFAGYGAFAKIPFPGIPELECPLTRAHTALPARKKLEENVPFLTLQVSNGKNIERLTLAYDRFGTGLKWPILNGEYLVRFQPQFQPIPHSIRLREARQINYPHSGQPYSYESDLIIDEKVEKTISMNHVHETEDGYRFYLANIAPGNETAAKRVQIVVNHDPAKSILTYPGAIILAIGMLLLFWIKRS